MSSSMPMVAREGPLRQNATSAVEEPAENWPCSIDQDLRNSFVAYLERKVYFAQTANFFSEERANELRSYVKEKETRTFDIAMDTKEYLRLISELIGYIQEFIRKREEKKDQFAGGEVSKTSTSRQTVENSREMQQSQPTIQNMSTMFYNKYKTSVPSLRQEELTTEPNKESIQPPVNSMLHNLPGVRNQMPPLMREDAFGSCNCPRTSLNMQAHHNMMQQMNQLEQRLRNTRTPEERTQLFNELMKTPHLFSAILTMSKDQEGQQQFPATAMFAQSFARDCAMQVPGSVWQQQPQFQQRPQQESPAVGGPKLNQMQVDSWNYQLSTSRIVASITTEMLNNQPDVFVPSSNATSGPLNPEKRQKIQQQLVLLLHAEKCQKRENEWGEKGFCTIPHCNMMKEVHQHMPGCNEGRDCKYPHCASSRQIIGHWKDCQDEVCWLCQPLKTLLNNPSSNAHSSKNVPGAPSINANPAKNADQMPHTVSEVSVISKVWQTSVSKDFRNLQVGKLVKAIFPSQDANTLLDQRIKDSITNAREVEQEMFEMANDREEHHHLIDAKISKIQTELQEKMSSRFKPEPLSIADLEELNLNCPLNVFPHPDVTKWPQGRQGQLMDSKATHTVFATTKELKIEADELKREAASAAPMPANNNMQFQTSVSVMNRIKSNPVNQVALSIADFENLSLEKIAETTAPVNEVEECSVTASTSNVTPYMTPVSTPTKEAKDLQF